MKAKLYFKYGAMGAAKTAQLLITNFNYIEKGMSTVLITSSIDDRDGLGIIKSRIGIEAKADILAAKSTNIYNRITSLIKKQKIDVILVEEAQFLTAKQIDQLTDIVDTLNITVFCFGLKQDFRFSLFSGSKRLLEVADTISEIKTMCKCGRKAVGALRIKNGKVVKKGDQVYTGGNESYIAVCRKCWKLERD